MARRYAIYFAPRSGTVWWRFGARWLCRDAITGQEAKPYQVSGMTSESLLACTTEPRRYGFHATLKPPFALAQGVSEQALHVALENLAALQPAFSLGPLRVEVIGGFLALVAAHPPEALARLASSCVSTLDHLRELPGADELARRRSAGLSARQEALLKRWGYPYVMDEWRFHMTLTDSLQDAQRTLLQGWLQQKVARLSTEAMEFDSLCLFEQPGPGADFCLTRRITLRPRQLVPACAGSVGRLFYVVGPSGSGKDSLLAYARARLISRSIVFARRYITRPSQPGAENHRVLNEAEFLQQLRRGGFALHWSSHGYMYGIGTEIDLWLARGRDVVVNGSREYLEEARTRYPDLKLVWIEASEPLLRARLAARAREDQDAVERRLQRAVAFTPPADALCIANEGSLHDAGNKLIDVLCGQPAEAV